MICPFCGSKDTQVKDSRPNDEDTIIRRRRSCVECGSRFTTLERVQLCPVTVVKNSGDRESFDREKLARSIQTAVRKRHMKTDQIERVVNAIIRKIETYGESEITTETIGAYVLSSLRELDEVAYIRFASVYKDFSSVEDFTKLITNLKKKHEQD
ncbi:MAG: transcriptional regulator NrdR [Rickettsiales bacterium]|nr:transcriptional regulator NrdR [Rickettsiales bacterium]|tara:strand:- start:17951 stop:18415 length:465 start_codon:yes stop_codon:yes gene_type:complete